GEDHSVALKSNGSVVAWGDNYGGQVTGTPTSGEESSAIATPVTLGGQVLTDVVAISGGRESHRGVEERWHGGRMGLQQLRPSNRGRAVLLGCSKPRHARRP